MKEQKLNITRATIWLGFLALIWIIAYVVILQKYPDHNFVPALALIYAITIGTALFFVQWTVIPRVSFLNQSSQIVIKSIVYGAAFTTGYFPGWVIEIMWKYSHKTKTDIIEYTTTTIKNLISAPFSGKPIGNAIPSELIDAFTSIFAVLFLVIILSSLAGYIDSRWRKEQLIKQSQENQIRFLTAQMQPHFLFNTLNTITSLVNRHPRKAEKLLINLSDFLRFNMNYSRRDKVELKEEIKFLENYLTLIKARFGDKLTWQITISPDCEDYPVPTLLLQPLVENAIKHGWPDREKPLHIDISAIAIYPDIILEVSDNGCGFSNHQSSTFPPSGHALELLQNRIKLIAGKDKTLSVQSTPDEGTQIKIKLPQ